MSGAAPSCAALLLTGGASRRFGSAKGELEWNGMRLADRGARLLAEVASPVLEVGPGYSHLDALWEDEPGSGPLAALVAGAAALEARHALDRPVLVLAVDLPFVEISLLRLLGRAPMADAVVPRVDGRAQPLCARYSVQALARARELVARGARSMQALLDVLDVDWLDEADWCGVATPRTFADIDTPGDAARFGLRPRG